MVGVRGDGGWVVWVRRSRVVGVGGGGGQGMVGVRGIWGQGVVGVRGQGVEGCGVWGLGVGFLGAIR